MTLCVAAQCMDNRRDKVLVAHEYATENLIGTAEIERRKLNWIGNEGFPVLMAGTRTRCRELISHIDDAWKKAAFGIDFIAACREGIRRYKYTLANEYISAKLGLTYDDFRGKFRRQIPKASYEKLIGDIQRIRFEADLLIVHFDSDGESHLLHINDGELEERSNFAAIGAGMPIAEAVFFQRRHSRTSSLAGGIYRTYEAMRLGGKNGPGVGERFMIGIVHFRENSAHWEYVQPGYLKLLEKEFRRIGPQKMTRQTVHRELIRKLYSN